MKKLSIIIMALILISVVSAGVILDNFIRPDVTTDITSAQKTLITEKYNSAEHSYLDCSNQGECYTCKVQIGIDVTTCKDVTYEYYEPFLERIVSEIKNECTTSNALTEPISICNFDQAKKIYDENRTWIGNYTMTELMELRIISIVNAETKSITILNDTYNLEGTGKDWNK